MPLWVRLFNSTSDWDFHKNPRILHHSPYLILMRYKLYSLVISRNVGLYLYFICSLNILINVSYLQQHRLRFFLHWSFRYRVRLYLFEKERVSVFLLIPCNDNFLILLSEIILESLHIFQKPWNQFLNEFAIFCTLKEFFHIAILDFIR